MTDQSLHFPRFYVTTPTACPYLRGRMERKVFTQLDGADAVQLNEALSRVGFRRSQSVAYRPACDNCNACISVRVVANRFQMQKRMRRIRKRNRDIIATPCSAKINKEQYNLLKTYLLARHKDGGMADMTYPDYAEMVENSPVPTMLVEYRLSPESSASPGHDDHEAEKSKGRLVGVALTDILSDGLSMVYSFYDPAESRRSLGTYMILDHIERATERRLRNLYLGYWIKDSPKMAYKRAFSPLERLGPEGWYMLPD